jgi:hypothetical protein
MLRDIEQRSAPARLRRLLKYEPDQDEQQVNAEHGQIVVNGIEPLRQLYLYRFRYVIIAR